MRNLLIYTALAGATVSPAFAQSDPIEACRAASENDAARIQCLETAIRTLMPAAAQRGPAVTVDEDETLILEGSAQEEVTGIGAEQVKRRQAEKMKGAPDEEELARAEAVVTEFAYTSLGNVILFLDNGQVWRQKDSDKNKVRLSGKRDYTVVVSEGMLSGYRLTINELKRTILVERIK